jgi:hypothetical protein
MERSAVGIPQRIAAKHLRVEEKAIHAAAKQGRVLDHAMILLAARSLSPAARDRISSPLIRRRV